MSPTRLGNGQVVACRKCWQCNENRVNDWVGRCIAESMTAVASSSVTLTYGRDEHDRPDHVRAAVLTYSDVQKYLKRLRVDGYPCRFFAVGEHGTLKGRSHWHLVLFWKDAVPPHPIAERFAEKHWPHGVSFFEEVTPASIRYVCKYIQKDHREMARQGHLQMSKRPPLGAAFFRGRALEYVKAGLAPQDAFYSFRDVKDRSGRPVRFMLTGKSLDLFCEAFVQGWRQQYPGRWWPVSDLIEEYLDREVVDDQEWRPDPVMRRMGKPWAEPPAGFGPVEFSEVHNAYFSLEGGAPSGRRLWWSYDVEGNRAWADEIRTDRGRPDIRAAAIAYREASMPSTRR